jgi:hypothetical protein
LYSWQYSSSYVTANTTPGYGAVPVVPVEEVVMVEMVEEIVEGGHALGWAMSMVVQKYK